MVLHKQWNFLFLFFDVKSAYHLHRELVSRNEGECSNGRIQNDVWKSIWKLDVLNAMRMFIWKLIKMLYPLMQICGKGQLWRMVCAQCVKIFLKLLGKIYGVVRPLNMFGAKDA